MRTHGRDTAVRRTPGAQDAPHPGQQPFKIRGLLFQQGADVRARRGAGAAERHDVLDFREGQPEPPSLADEGEQAEDVDGIATVARRLTTWRRQHPARLV